MKINFSRSFTIFCSVYTIVIGVVMMAFALLSICAYRCLFYDAFVATPEFYFFHLFYYRSQHCEDKYVDWSILGLENSAQLNDLIRMPDQNSLVSRTYRLTLIQLVINGLLVLTSIVILTATASNIYFVSRKVTYFLLFAPYFFVFHVAIVFDFVAGTFYSDDRLRSYAVDGTMRMLEIANPDESRPYIEQINERFRIAAPNVMFHIFTKAMIVNIVNVFLLFGIVFACWDVVNENKLRRTKKEDK